jgi:hypothetical protein
MPNVVQQAIACDVVDTDAKLTPAVIAQVAAKGYAGVVRYVPLPGVKADNDIDAGELQAIVDGGLAAMLVQHVRYPGWNPAMCSGQGDALAAIETAKTAGYLPGGHIFLDLEGIDGSAADTKVFAEQWGATIVQAGYCAGCYVGYGVPLNAVQLYNLHDFHSYWSDAGPRQVATRGFAMKQKGPAVTIGGIRFDPDTMQPDRLGDMPFWMIARAADDNVASA